MKPSFMIQCVVAVLASSLSAPVFAAGSAGVPYTGSDPVLNEDVIGSSITITAATPDGVGGDTTTSQGVINASAGEYEVVATGGDIVVTNTNIDGAGGSALLANGDGAKLTVSGTGDIYASGRVGIGSYNGGSMELSAGASGVINVRGEVYYGLHASGASSSMTLNSDSVISAVGTGIRVEDQAVFTSVGQVEVTSDDSGINSTDGARASFQQQVSVTSKKIGIVSLGGTLSFDGQVSVETESIGILAKGESSLITLNADTTVNSTGTAIQIEEKGVLTSLGKVNIIGSGNGINCASEASASFQQQVLVNSSGRGILASDKGAVTFHEGVEVSAGATGVWANGGTLVFAKPVSVNTTGTGGDVFGICAGANADSDGSRATVSLAGGSVSAASGVALYASYGQITGSAARYDIKGNIHAANGGEVDLRLTGNSLISGVVDFRNSGGGVSTGTINLDMQGDSLWQVAGNSALTNLTLGQGSGLQLAFSGSSLTDIITATGTITLEAGSMIYLTGDLSSLQGESFDFFTGTVDNRGVRFVGFDGTEWVEYEYTQTGANTFEFSANAPVTIEEPGFIPEPATATLGLLGLASLMVRRRRV